MNKIFEISRNRTSSQRILKNSRFKTISTCAIDSKNERDSKMSIQRKRKWSNIQNDYCKSIGVLKIVSSRSLFFVSNTYEHFPFSWFLLGAQALNRNIFEYHFTVGADILIKRKCIKSKICNREIKEIYQSYFVIQKLFQFRNVWNGMSSVPFLCRVNGFISDQTYFNSDVLIFFLHPQTDIGE